MIILILKGMTTLLCQLQELPLGSLVWQQLQEDLQSLKETNTDS